MGGGGEVEGEERNLESSSREEGDSISQCREVGDSIVCSLDSVCGYGLW